VLAFFNFAAGAAHPTGARSMAATRITVMNSGSLRIEGDFEIVDQNGGSFGLAGRNRVSLCRCGHSAKKPFCDGTHKSCGFDSMLIAFDLEPPAPKPGV
jgi:CDGSH-type Zn-finger protein